MTPDSTRIPVLAYHAIGDGDSPLCVSPGRFAAHVASLHAGGWEALAPGEFLAGLSRGQWPRRRVLVTFDDALESVRRHAMPVLERYGWPSLIFTVAGRVGGVADWSGWPAGVDGRLMDRASILACQAAGAEIGAHGISHRRLSWLSEDECRLEVAESRTRLEDLCGRPVRTFAYPYGDAPPSAVRLVAETYDAGFGIDLGDVTSGAPRAVLPRIDAYYVRDWRNLSGLDGSCARTYLAARGLARALRRSLGFGYGAGSRPTRSDNR